METDWLERVSPCIRPIRSGETALSYTSHADAQPNWIEPQRVIYDHELVIFSQGRFAVDLEGKKYPCPAGTFIIIPPGKRHTSWETDGSPAHRYFSHFDWICQGTYDDTPVMTFHPAKPRPNVYRLAPGFVPRKVFYGPIHAPQRVYELAERLCALQTHVSQHDWFVSRAMLLELLLELLDTRDRGVPASKPVDLAQQVRVLLEQNLSQHGNLRIQDLMEQHLRRSYAHLCRMFRARYGVPPLKYLNAICVSRAKLLFRGTDLPVAVIARRLGFRDPLYFSQLFRKTTGLSPSQFRRQT